MQRIITDIEYSIVDPATDEELRDLPPGMYNYETSRPFVHHAGAGSRAKLIIPIRLTDRRTDG